MKPPIPTVGATDTTPYNASDASSDALRLARVGQLEADAARLDWLERAISRRLTAYATDDGRVMLEWYKPGEPSMRFCLRDTLRTAIDAARAALESEEQP